MLQYTGNALKNSMQKMSANTKAIKKINLDIQKMANNVKAKAEQAKSDIARSDWTNALKKLVEMLQIAVKESGQIRSDLDKITKDLVTLKKDIETMVMNAENEYKRKVQDLQNRINNEQRRINNESGCFKDAMKGFLTIISFGVTCAISDATLNQLKNNKRNLENSKRSFEGSVGPEIQKLSGLTTAASNLLTEGFAK